MSSAAQVPAKKQQDLQVTYSNYKNTLQQIAQRIGDIEQEAEEHKLVLETLEPLSEDRKCFRLINGVLVERTVKDVVPALKTNQEGLRKVLDDLVKQYKTKQDDLEKWKSLQQRSHSSVSLLSTIATPSDLPMFLLQPHLDVDKTDFRGLLAFQMPAFQAERATRRKKWKDGVDALYTCCALWGYGGKSVCMPNRIEAP
ncbi:prefoldin subunit 2 [Fusarium pseudoanthophilum]|uniref:Prefoldin subunit 2 n=1 Tax=Fusarium pseudoanthophilum TaxID=48495 RepID=A0A8H5NT54_9HYPO|nr:prefoldin subunit 2 [Fusarium pseudoanthophilum]